MGPVIHARSRQDIPTQPLVLRGAYLCGVRLTTGRIAERRVGSVNDRFGSEGAGGSALCRLGRRANFALDWRRVRKRANSIHLRKLCLEP